MGDDDVDLGLLRQSARDFLAGRGEKDSVEDLARMDWTGLLVDESRGGAGWRPVETCVVAEELGRASDRSAWWGTTVAAAALASAPEGIRQRWLDGLLDGSVTAGCTTAGDIARVIRGDAVRLVVTLGANGVHVVELPDTIARDPDEDLLDVTRGVRTVDLSATSAVAIGSPDDADRLRSVARLLLSADSVGAMSTTFERLTAYLKDRVAFGVPIASFQAVQHRLVELLMFEVRARAVIMKAARASAATDPRARALSTVAHAFVADKVTAAVDECMQLSGGIGFTWEYPLHYELRRVFTNSQLLGTARTSRAELVEVCGW